MLLQKFLAASALVFHGSNRIVYGLNFAFGFLIWNLCYPGFYSSDSFSAVEIAKTGNLNNWGGLTWAFFVHYFSLRGQFVQILTLINLLILIYSITFFLIEFLGKAMGKLISIGLTCSPLVFGFGNTLWHDVPFTAGMLLLSGALIRTMKVGSLGSKDLLGHLIASGFLITFRTNGVPTLLLLFTLIAVFYRFRGVVYRATFLTLASSLLFTLSLSLLSHQTPVNSVAAQEWMRADISCYAATNQGRIFVQEKLGSIGQLDKWESKSSCDGISQVKLTDEEYSKSTKIVPRAWLYLLIQEPGFVLHTHALRNAYLLPLPFFGLNRIPFLHSTIEFEDSEIEWRTPSLANLTRYPIRFANMLSFVLCWTGFWAALLLFFYIRQGRKDIRLLLMVVFSLSFILFIAGPIADGRYTIYVTIVGISALIRECNVAILPRGVVREN